MRAGIQGFKYSIDVKSDGVDYDADLELFSGLLAADWHPFGGGFKITGGVLINDNKISGTGRPTPGTGFTIGGTYYAAADVGRLEAEISYNAIAPYLGIGWGNPFSKDSNWTFFVDIGVVFMGSPDVDVRAYGEPAIINNADFRASLERERRDLENDLDSYKYYPVVTFGLSYKF